MKRIISYGMVLIIVMSISLPLKVSAESEAEYINIVGALGIMNGDENGNLHLDKNVTRGEFSKMIVAASKYKDTVGNKSSASLYKDVKSNYWGTGYIKVAVEQGWFRGYIDGTFRPNNAITLEEGVAVILRVLGYSAEDLTGAFPYAHLDKYRALGLDESINLKKGQQLTRLDCAKLFVNLMAAEMSDGTIYGKSLGYKMNDGRIDYYDLIKSDTKGPYIATGEGLNLTFTPDHVIRNNGLNTIDGVRRNDVYYYNVKMKRVWVYDAKASGTLTDISPNIVEPETVTIGGVEYELSTESARTEVSFLGEYVVGDIVTVLLDREESVAGIINAGDDTISYYGVVNNSEPTTLTVDERVVKGTEIEIYCTDGVARTFKVNRESVKVGYVVEVSFENGETKVSQLSSKNLEGRVTEEGIGKYAFASSVQIIDTNDEGDARKIYKSRIVGAKLKRGNIVHYALDLNGNISRLVLRNVTGDTEKYVYFTDIEETEGSSMEQFGVYTYIDNGVEGAIPTARKTYNISIGGGLILYKDGEISSVRNLKSVKIDALDRLAIGSENQTYRLADDVEVYLYSNKQYVKVPLEDVLDSENNDYIAWYDEFNYPAGRNIRIIIVK